MQAVLRILCERTGKALHHHGVYILLSRTGSEQYKQVNYIVGRMGISPMGKNKQERGRVREYTRMVCLCVHALLCLCTPILNRTDQEGLYKIVTSEQRPRKGEELRLADILV